VDQLPDELKPESPIARRLLQALQRAYFAHVTNHDPLIGCDGFTLGVGLWRGSWYFVEQEFPDLVRRPNGTFYLEFPDYNLYVYRDRPNGKGHRIMGDSEVQRAFLRVNSQVCFDFLQSNVVTGKPNLVALHTGRLPVGLTDVGIGLPVAPTDPNTSWFFFERVFFHEPTTPETPPQVGEPHRRFDELDVPEIDIFPEYELGDDEASGEGP
jgi:hypothetical protein